MIVSPLLPAVVSFAIRILSMLIDYLSATNKTSIIGLYPYLEERYTFIAVAYSLAKLELKSINLTKIIPWPQGLKVISRVKIKQKYYRLM